MKYELTDIINDQGLKQIKRISDGQLGGWIEKEENLSQSGDCWVFEKAQVSGEAQVFENAQVFGKIPNPVSNSYFPILIKSEGRKLVIQKPENLPMNVAFTIIETNIEIN